MKNQKTALVTGANKGIGLEVARQLARKNFHVFIGARNVEAGNAAVSEIGDLATFLEIDVSDLASIRAAATKLDELVDRLDVLVNNAGILLDNDKAVLEITPKIF